jgi:hypothetical protein
LSAKNSTKGSSMPRPGLVLSAMVASGQPLFCFGFWSRACAARRRAGPRAAAQRGGAGAAGSRGGALPRALVSRGVCSFLAPICVTSELREWSRCGGMDSLGPARAETRGRGHPRDACRPRDSRGPRARGRGATQGDATNRRAQAYQTGDPSAAWVPGRAPGSVATMSVSPPRSLKKPSRANPLAPKRRHANPRPTVAAPPPQHAPPPQPRKKPGAPNTTDKPAERRARAPAATE